MTDYSQLSDFEINRMVAFALGCKEVVHGIFMSDDRRYEFDKPKNKSGNKFYFNPCNNPADAWPIISEHNIGIAPYRNTLPHAWSTAFGMVSDFNCMDKNPLRAAMVVFLMMQENAD